MKEGQQVAPVPIQEQWQQQRRRKLGCQGPGWRRAKQRVQRTAAAAAGLERMNARDLGATRTTVS